MKSDRIPVSVLPVRLFVDDCVYAMRALSCARCVSGCERCHSEILSRVWRWWRRQYRSNLYSGNFSTRSHLWRPTFLITLVKRLHFATFVVCVSSHAVYRRQRTKRNTPVLRDPNWAWRGEGSRSRAGSIVHSISVRLFYHYLFSRFRCRQTFRVNPVSFWSATHDFSCVSHCFSSISKQSRCNAFNLGSNHQTLTALMFDCFVPWTRRWCIYLNFFFLLSFFFAVLEGCWIVDWRVGTEKRSKLFFHCID